MASISQRRSTGLSNRPMQALRANAGHSGMFLPLELCAALLLGLILFVIGLAMPLGVLAIPALALYLWLQTIYFRIDARAFVLIAPLTITTASSVVALVLIEQGVKIFEIGRFGSAGNYTLQFVFFDMLFMIAYLFAYKAMTGGAGQREGIVPARLQMSAKLNAILSPLVLVMSFGSIAALIFLGLTKGFPLLTGTDRFVFRRSLGNGLFLYILNLKSIITFLLGMVTQLSNTRRMWILSFVIMFLLTIMFFLFGDKFFTILTSLALYITPWLYNQHRQLNQRLPLVVAVAILASVPSIGVTWLIYSNAGRISTFETLNKFSGRIVGQGELWYVQSHAGAPLLDWNSSLIDRNIQALSEKDADIYALEASLGPNYFSDRYAPGNIALSIHHNAGSVTYTAALEPLGLVMFGWAGLAIVKMVCGVLAAGTVSYLAWAIRNRSLVSGLFAIYIYTTLMTTLRQGTPWVFFGLTSFKWLGVIVFVEIILGVLILAMGRDRTTR